MSELVSTERVDAEALADWFDAEEGQALYHCKLVRALGAERDMWKATAGRYVEERDDTNWLLAVSSAEADRLEVDNTTLRAALEFYADRDSYDRFVGGNLSSDAEIDRGATARTALSPNQET